jgi:Domain of unknown function (DUF4922)
VKLSDKKIFSDSKIQNLLIKNDYSSAVEYLFESQLNSWPLMKSNYDSLKSTQTKSLWFDGFNFKIQFNPERIKSTSADVDKISIEQRPCFLCLDNLPEEQKGIILENNFILLCNPYPIFQQHFTISTLIHKPQRIKEHFSEFLELSKLLSPKFTLIYNGPACGASAPDHFHFQAGIRNYIPIENDIQQMKNDFGSIIQENEFISTTFIDDGLRRLVLMQSEEQSLIEKSFNKIFNVYETITPTDPEPMMNLLCNYNQEFGWSLIIFLRSKHRPECFYRDDPDKILVSPAAVDLGGLVVTPREEDFMKVDKELLWQIINEVSPNHKVYSEIYENVKVEIN